MTETSAPGWGTLLGVLAGMFGPILLWFSTRGKTDADVSVAVLAEWKALISAHKETVKSLQLEVNSLRERLDKAELRISELEARERSLLDENAGLKRQLAQKAQSEMQVLGPGMSANAPVARERFAGNLLDKLDGKG